MEKFPSRYIFNVGYPRTSNRGPLQNALESADDVQSIFPNAIFPSKYGATASNVGANCLQCPHHGATTTKQNNTKQNKNQISVE